EGIGTLDLTALNHNQWTRWEITKLGGTIPSNAGISSQLILSSGKLFDWRSPLSSSEHIVTRLRVTSNEIVDDINYNNEVRERIETSRFSDNKIGIDRAGLYIHKLSLKSEPVNYVIEAYHKDVLLGKLNVTVTNNRKTNIGEVVFNIDKRIQSAVGKWMTSEGKLYNGFSDNSPNNYRNMLNVDGEFTQIASRIKEVRSINNENNFLTNSPSIGNIKYKIIQPNSDYYDESAMPYEIPFNSLRSNLIISTLNRNTEDNRFVLRGDDGVLYEGNVKEKYIGEIALEGTGTLDLTGLNLGEWSSWNQVKGSGDLQSNTSQGGKSSILKMGNNKLFDWTSQLPNGNTPIVTKLKITKNNEESKEKVIEIGNRVEIEFTDNKIGIDRNGLFIHKLSSKSEPVNYLIEAYYGEILLGKLNLKVENGHGFSIIDGDRIDFGDFFPGDSKEVSTIIEIKNPLEANIDIKLSDTSRNEMYKSGVKINSNTTIPIKNINVVELNTIGKDINSFKISATAVTTKDTVVGEYSGEIEVTITIIPK
ncbi:hypothetical protein, partial [Cetobacterium sp.]|uniref:hypothetical protein n=1 Tax=Cetobacterium sp. TaxID=2071632 RepID=UPI003F2D9621